MPRNALECLGMFWNAWECLEVFRDVCGLECLGMFRMLGNVWECRGMFGSVSMRNAWECFDMLRHAYKRLGMLRNVWECFDRAFRNAEECLGAFRNVYERLGMLRNIWQCVGMSRNVRNGSSCGNDGARLRMFANVEKCLVMFWKV